MLFPSRRNGGSVPSWALRGEREIVDAGMLFAELIDYGISQRAYTRSSWKPAFKSPISVWCAT